ncbi:MAG: tRNA (N6-isopentenyl adenosine(37)-C2)-methylthiotransferase MiaB [Clostridia bacterium]
MEIWGCQMNEHDAEIAAGIIEEKGYLRTDEPEKADVILLYTCCVREKAEQKALARIGVLRKIKDYNPSLQLCVGGCLTQQKDFAAQIKSHMPEVDLIFGTHNLPELGNLLEEAQRSHKTVVEIVDQRAYDDSQVPVTRNSNIKAYVNIIYGCNNFCTYCIVPHVRGRELSRKPHDILMEIEELEQAGYQEIMLLGQNVNSYGKDFQDRNYDFADLLQEISERTNIPRIRYMTSHPRDCNDKLLLTLKSLPKVMPHFHMPVQAGSTDVLRRMNRGYTKESYLALIAKIKRDFPTASITTDIIIGFPGETEEDFLDTYEVLEQVRFDMAFTYLYSPRPGTTAAKMTESFIPEKVKKERFDRLLELQNRISLEVNKMQQDKIAQVLVEGYSKTDKEMLMGRTEQNKLVIFPGSKTLIGKIVPVRLENIQTWTIYGTLQIEGKA